MPFLELLTALLGQGLPAAVALDDALARPPQELLENIELFDDLPFLETDEEAE